MPIRFKFIDIIKVVNSVLVTIATTAIYNNWDGNYKNGSFDHFFSILLIYVVTAMSGTLIIETQDTKLPKTLIKKLVKFQYKMFLYFSLPTIFVIRLFVSNWTTSLFILYVLHMFIVLLLVVFFRKEQRNK